MKNFWISRAKWKIAVAGLIFEIGTGISSAQTWQQNGGGSYSWNSGLNWSGGTVPNSTTAAAAFNSSGLTAAETITLDSAITVNSLTIGDTAFAYTIAPGTSGTLTFGGTTPALTVGAGSQNVTISAPITLSAATTFTNNSVVSGELLSIAGAIAGGANNFTVGGAGNTTFGSTVTTSGTFTKSGTGTVILSAAGALATGAVTVSGGTLQIAATTLSSTLTVNLSTASSMLSTTGTISTTANSSSNYKPVTGTTGSIAINWASTATNPAFNFNSNDASNNTSTTNYGTQINSPVNLGANQAYIFVKTNHNGVSQYGTSADAAFLQPVSGSGGITLIAQNYSSASGPMEAPLYLYAANTFTGRLEIQRGSVYLGNNGSLAQAAAGNGYNVLQFDPATGNNARLFLYGHNASVSDLQSSGAGTPVIAASPGGSANIAAETLTIYQNNSFTYAGTIVQNQFEYATTQTGTLGGLGIVKQGPATLTLSGANTYTGATTIGAGTLSITGSLAAASAVAVNSGGALAGTGSVPGTVTVNSGGAVTAGVGGSGTLSIGSLILGTASANTETLNVTRNSTPGLIAVAGALTVNSGTNDITVNVSGAAPAVGQYPLLTYTGTALNSAGFAAFKLGTLPNRVVGNLVNNTSGLSVDLAVTGVDFPVWTGASTSNWNTADVNWVLNSNNATTTTYQVGDSVLFNDLASSGHTTVNINGADVSPGGVTFNNSSNSYILAGSNAIAGNAGLTKNGSGTLTITNVNSFTGAVTFNAGTVAVNAIAVGGTNSPLGSGSSFIFNGGTLSYTGATAGTDRSLSLQTNGGTVDVPTSGTALTLSGAISGAGALTVNSAATSLGAVTLASTANTFAGGLIVNGGAVNISSDANLGTAPTSATAGAITLNNASVLQITATATINANRGIAGTGSLAFSGGTLTMSGANTYSGGTALNAGALSIANGTELGSGTLKVNLTSGSTFLTVTNTAAVTLPNAITLPSPSTAQTFQIQKYAATSTTGTQLNLTGNITGGSATTTLEFNSNTSGDSTTSYRLAGVNSFTVSKIDINRGVLILHDANSAGAATNLILLDSNGNSTLGNLRFETSYTLPNPIQINSTYPINTDVNNVVLGGTVSGAGPLTKLGTGMLTVNAAGSYTGATTISAGTLAVGASGSINTSSSITMASGAVLDISAQPAGITVGTGGPATLTAAGRTSNFATDINGNLTVAGGTLTLGTTSTTPTVTQAGNLTLSGTNTINLSLSGAGTTSGAGVNALLAVSGNLTASGTTTFALSSTGGGFASGNYTLLTYGGTLTGSAGNFAFSGFSGGRQSASIDTTTTSGAVLLDVVGNAANLVWTGAGIPTAAWDTNTANTAWTNTATSSADAFYSGDNVTFDNTGAANSTITIASGVTVSPGSVTFNGSTNYTISGAGTIAGVGTTLTVNGGTVTVATTNSFGGGVFLNGGVLSVAAVANTGTNSPLGASGTITFNGGTLQYTGATAATTNRPITLSSGGGTLDFPVSGATLTLAGTIGGAGGLTISTTTVGTVGLSGTNTFTGPVTVNGGTLSIAADANLGAAPSSATPAAVTLNSPGILQTTATATINANRGITGTGSVVVAAGTLTLPSANSYSGGTTVAGTVAIQNAGALGSGPVTVTAATTFLDTTGLTGIQAVPNAIVLPNDTAAANHTIYAKGGAGNGVQLTGTISGGSTNSVLYLNNSVSDGGGIFEFTDTAANPNTFATNTTGTGITLNHGALQVDSATALGANANSVYLDSYSPNRIIFGGSFAYAHPTAIAYANASFDTGNNSVTASGIISGSVGIIKLGAGTLTLTGPNTYTGGTTLNAGVVALTSASSTPLGVPSGTNGVTFAGGTLDTTNAGASQSFSLGTLNQTTTAAVASTISLGSASHTLNFTAPGTGLNNANVGTPLSTLTITGWTGVAGGNGTGGEILFTGIGTTAAVADTNFSKYLSTVSFSGFSQGAEFISNGANLELVPVPEPASLLGLTGLAFAGAARFRRRRAAV